VADRFNGLRRIYLGVHLVIVLLLATVFGLCCWLAVAVTDYHFELSLDTRRIALAVVAAAAFLWMAVRTVSLARQVQQDTFAGHLEATFGDFGQRIRTVLDTVRGKISGPPEMLSALGHQTMGRWETLSPEQLVPRRILWFSVTVTILAACSCAGLILSGGDWNTAMLRAAGHSVPYTELSVDPGNTRVLEGTAINV
jgi:hypothetical protein